MEKAIRETHANPMNFAKLPVDEKSTVDSCNKIVELADPVKAVVLYGVMDIIISLGLHSASPSFSFLP